jgi:ectoine hydroxylase
MDDAYESRAGERWEAVDRPDPVVWGDAPGPLDEEELRDFYSLGFRFCDSLFSSEEVCAFAEELHRIIDRADPSDPTVVAEPDSDAVRSVFRVHQSSDVFREVAEDPRLLDPIRQILGTDVYIHQSRVNVKPACHGREFFWHSDFETWHVEDGMPRPRAVSVSVALTENTEFNGPLMVIPGSHKLYVRCVGRAPEEHYRSSLRKQEFGTPTEEALRYLVDTCGGINAPRGPAGSALFFECNLMHGSAGNLSPYPRTNLFLVYNSVENAVREPYGRRPPRPEFLAEREPAPLGTG